MHAARADSEQTGYDAANAVDGDPSTMWHTGWGDAEIKFPHELIIELESPRNIAGITTLPRQDGNPNGWIKGYEVFVSLDGKEWGQPIAQGELPQGRLAENSQISRDSYCTIHQAPSPHRPHRGPWASLAELNLLPGDREVIAPGFPRARLVGERDWKLVRCQILDLGFDCSSSPR